MLALPLVLLAAAAIGDDQFAKDPKQAVNQSYTEQIRKYTTAPALNSPLTNYLPASKTVPTPAVVLGDVAGAPTRCLMPKMCTATSGC